MSKPIVRLVVLLAGGSSLVGLLLRDRSVVETGPAPALGEPGDDHPLNA